MKMVTITIENFDNAAMDDNPEFEVCNILDGITDKIRAIGFGAMPIVLRDSNGNKVGFIDVE